MNLKIENHQIGANKKKNLSIPNYSPWATNITAQLVMFVCFESYCIQPPSSYDKIPNPLSDNQLDGENPASLITQDYIHNNNTKHPSNTAIDK
jgi:hypothetical protein